LIGQSGCGKSTCIGLLERFYDRSSGEILIDGVPIEQYDIKQLRDRIALVSQQPILFARTVKENILLGAIDGQTPSDDDVIAAAKRANAHDFISKLQNGYDTIVGEKGFCDYMCFVVVVGERASD
jgi:ABC-type multidrug transport system fused ATPase/permease subunit